MIFSKESVEAILAGSKVQTRRLVKEDDFWHTKGTKFEKKKIEIPQSKSGYGYVFKTIKEGTIVGVGKPDRVKWQVGRDYAVQLGRGKPGLWRCENCGLVKDKYFVCNCNRFLIDPPYVAIPFRIKVTGIRKEKLLDISEEDARKEGFDFSYASMAPSKVLFLGAFLRINYSKYKKYWDKDIHVTKIKELWKKIGNPAVWVLDFEVK